jgi:hypothetical protein
MTGKIMKTYYNILNKLKINLTIEENPHKIHPAALFEVGARINPKRSFLFISKIIGKHLRINPDTMFAAGKLLGLLYLRETYKKYEFDSIINSYISYINGSGDYTQINSINLKKKTLFIGFAETATGIASSVFSLFGENAFFICTTREHLHNCSNKIEFLEEHSHAADQICHLSKEELNTFDDIVLIDDELTTGNTNLNIITKLNEISPGKNYTLISILDWRNEENLKKYKIFSKNNSLKINSVSLIRGIINIEKDFVFLEDETDNTPVYRKNETFTTEIKEYKINNKNIDSKRIVDQNYTLTIEKEAENIAEFLKNSFDTDNSVVVGSGEFIYFPAVICKYLAKLNNTEIKYQSFSRSPVLKASDNDYPVNFKISFNINGINYYLYNINNSVKNVLLIFDKRITESDIADIQKAFSKTGAEKLLFLFLVS